MSYTSGSSPLARGLPQSTLRRMSTWTDHPRSRGVYVVVFPARACAVGSSPLARGLPTTGHGTTYRYGIIPARAGFTRPGARSRSTLPGSSPLARGLLHDKGWGPVAGTIIPARAGFTAAAHRRAPRPAIIPARAGFTTSCSTWRWRGSRSSPLARGLPHRHGAEPVGEGIIPARAGFTIERMKSAPRAQDHPRSRGVYTGGMRMTSCVLGSSPLARGLPWTGPTKILASRIIPARAGFTRRHLAQAVHRRDHPRSRGVYAEPDPAALTRIGSSPLARGLLGRPSTHSDGPGIIPARAGFTTRCSPGRTGATDHPRSRGVYIGRRGHWAHPAGSSPLARGLQRVQPRRLVRGGIIPARAGFTDRHGDCRGEVADHPRSRGVYRPEAARADPGRGSSPLARGLPGPTPWPWTGITDHPRSRGVYVADQPRRVIPAGSSPLARGLPPAMSRRRRPPGIIPARAGFTSRRRG